MFSLVRLELLKGHCHGDFAVFWSKLLKCLTKNLFAKIKLLLEHWEEDIKGFLQERTNYNQFLTTSLNYTRRKNWPIFSSYNLFSSQPSTAHIINTSFCAIVGVLLLTKLNHYFNDSTIQVCFLAIQSDR